MHRLNKKLKDNLYCEIHILKGLHHPHIVSLIDCVETTAHIHLVMEFCTLGDLSYFIRKRDTLGQHDTTADMVRKYPNPPGGGLNEVIVRHFLKQLASALEFLRVRNFIHRDVKPQNLLLDPSPVYMRQKLGGTEPSSTSNKSTVPSAGIESLPTLKLADFGFARSLPSTSLAETLCGSPLYMAPEILRYEKYDAKADLWSVGTVLYEMMTARPPFRAQNHVDLLRRIERGEDRLKFPEEAVLSDSMKKFIKGLLKRNPIERVGFNEFFSDTVVKDEIPGLVEGDSTVAPKIQDSTSAGSPLRQESATIGHRVPGQGSEVSSIAKDGLSRSPSNSSGRAVQATTARPAMVTRRSSTTPLRPIPQTRAIGQAGDISAPQQDSQERTAQRRRPSMVSLATAPARQDLHEGGTRVAGAAMQRQSSRNSPTPATSVPKERTIQRERVQPRQEDKAAREAREARERAAQDVAFERDYVVVEKRAVEVNAFADELAASPRIHGISNNHRQGTMTRRATTQEQPIPTTGNQVNTSRAMQLASGKRPEQTHQRQVSYETRIKGATSATSAISRAINMASGRIFSMGFSPPLSLGRGGVSPPTYSPFPAYPTTHGSLVMIGDGSKLQTATDEDTKAIMVMEEAATRSDVVYGFAEVKYKQIIPLVPSLGQGLGLQQATIPQQQDDIAELTVEAVVTLSEEALVLYVKALSLLARSMDIAGRWWARKNRGEIIEESTSPRTQSTLSSNTVIGGRVNNVVQWVRGRFNEVLEKAELVRLKLLEAQKQLPTDHLSHPSNHPSVSRSDTSMGTSADNVVVSPGVTAERLMYDRALEMSRASAVNELLAEDLPGCEIAYITAIRMLEAILEDEEEPAPKKRTSTSNSASKESKSSGNEEESINGVDAEDRDVVLKCKPIS